MDDRLNQIIEPLNERFDGFKWKRYLTLLIILVLAVIFFRRYSVVIGLMVATGVVSWATSELSLRWTGIEAATLTTVLVAVAFGPVYGAVIGFLTIVLQMMAGGYIGMYMLWVVPSYAIAGFLVGSMATGGIVQTGIYTIVGLQAVFSLFTLALSPGRIGKYLPYAVGNVIFNVLAFQMLAPMILAAMA